MKYSIKKGLVKGIISALVVAGAMAAFSGFADISIWSLMEQYLKPLVGAMTVGGLITMAINFVKVKLS